MIESVGPVCYTVSEARLCVSVAFRLETVAAALHTE